MAEGLKPGKKGWKSKAEMTFVGGKPGKLHDELKVKEGTKIPAKKLDEAEHSPDPEVRRDATRAKTMEGWNHGAKKKKETLYDNPSSKKYRKSDDD